MNQIALIEPETEPQALLPAVVFAPGGVKATIERLKAEARAEKTDISTPKGRAAIKSLVYKIARSKTALDTMGKELTDEQRARIDAVNADRRYIRDELDALGEEIRKPLTDWENADKARIAGHEAALQAITETGSPGGASSVADLEVRLAFLRGYPAREWQEFSQRAAETLAAEIARTEALHQAAVTREAEQAELARLRAEAEERARQEAARLQAEREARIAAEAAEAARVAAEERAAAEARAAEERAAAEARAAAAKAEAERQAVEQARREAEERAARLEAQARQAEADSVAAVAKAEADAAEAARQAEAARVAAAERAERERQEAVAAERRRAEREAAQARHAAEAAAAADAARAADRKHRGAINSKALAAIVALGISEADAKTVILAIVAGSIPNVSMRY
jgi:hypothetical protein